jgi:hypothetical protein
LLSRVLHNRIRRRDGTRIRRLSTFVILSGSLAATSFAAAPAQAIVAGPPVIDSLICEQIGRNSFICDAVWSGGTDPATWNWTVTNGAFNRTAVLNGNPHTLYAAGICNINTTFVVRLTVTDATNASATAMRHTACRRFPV